MRILIASLLLACAPPLYADFDDFGPPRMRRASLFVAPDDEASADPKPAKPANAEPEPEVEDEFPAPRRRYHHAGKVGIAFWATPFTRFTEDPSGVGVGFGFEFSHMFDEKFGAMISMSIWSINVRAFDSDDDSIRVDVTCFDIETGVRFHALNWRSGRMYTDLRLVLSFCDGAAPVRSSIALGGDMRWGFEFGDEYVRTFLEAGMGWRSALNHGNAGWVETGAINGSGGMFFDLLRVGMRLYF